MTLNAFLPLSLEPALIAVSIANKTRMCPLIAESGRYAVNILASAQQATSSHFAGLPAEDHGARFITINGVPMVEGAIARIGATVVDCHPVGDHTIYIGEVNHLEFTEDDPLIFFCGKYRTLSTKYEPHQYVDAWSMFDVVP